MHLGNRDYLRIERAILFLEENRDRQPELREVAAAVGLSEFHFQRLFRRWAGISPKRFLQFLTLEHAKRLLMASRSVLDTAYESGLSSPSRLHDLFVKVEAMTPGEFRAKGNGVRVSYGFHSSPFGECLLGITGRGICGLSFIQQGGRRAALDEFRRQWPEARLVHEPRLTRLYVDRIFNGAERTSDRPLTLLVRGTNFQLKVWQALLRIPMGMVTSYGELAAFLGVPRGARAVGGAVGRNPIAFVIPCHRVIQAAGATGGYGSGPSRKKAMLAWEAARSAGNRE